MPELIRLTVELNGYTGDLTLVENGNNNYDISFRGEYFLTMTKEGRLYRPVLSSGTLFTCNRHWQIKSGGSAGLSSHTGLSASALLKISGDDVLLDIVELNSCLVFRVNNNGRGCLFTITKHGVMGRARGVDPALPFQFNKEEQIKWEK